MSIYIRSENTQINGTTRPKHFYITGIYTYVTRQLAWSENNKCRSQCMNRGFDFLNAVKCASYEVNG